MNKHKIRTQMLTEETTETEGCLEASGNGQ